MGLEDTEIEELIHHDNSTNSIHLFLRTAKGSPYFYLGTLAYITHDADRQRPVYFQWQILNWPPPPELFERLELTFQIAIEPTPHTHSPETAGKLFIVEPPVPRALGRGIRTQEFKHKKSPNYTEQDELNRQLGLDGEQLVLKHERERLTSEGKVELAEKIVHVSAIEGDAAGYDIRSFELDGLPRHVEVKTTRGDAHTEFFLSANEVAFSAQNAATYYLYRLFEFDREAKSAKTFVYRGSVADGLDLKATVFRARVKRKID